MRLMQKQLNNLLIYTEKTSPNLFTTHPHRFYSGLVELFLQNVCVQPNYAAGKRFVQMFLIRAACSTNCHWEGSAKSFSNSNEESSGTRWSEV